MILIITDSRDISTYQVCDWLIYLKKEFIIFNENSVCKVLKYILTPVDEYFLLEIDGEILNTSKISTVWFRRGGLRLTYNSLNNLNIFPELKKEIENYVIDEAQVISKALTDYLLNLNYIGNPMILNKLIVLSNAVKIGLDIPATSVLSNKLDFDLIRKNSKEVISKGLQENFSFANESVRVHHSNQLWREEDIKSLPRTYQNTLFQEYIEKEFEIRVFFLCNICYSMAIFSQDNAKTSVDFRNYDKDQPNRIVPIKLPEEIETKINLLMNTLGLNSGSLDFIYSKNKKYVFLEVNPQGQFGWLSYNCNYNIERKIAEIL